MLCKINITQTQFLHIFYNKIEMKNIEIKLTRNYFHIISLMNQITF